MFRVCAPARAGLLCALRVLFVHLLHSSFVFVHLMHLDARLYRAKRVLMDARIAVEVAHHAYDWCTWRKSAIGHLCSRMVGGGMVILISQNQLQTTTGL